MLHSALNLVDRLVDVEEVDAHCDIPCKIYDPSTALIAALSVVRLMDIMAETMEKPDGLGRQNTIARCVLRKEEEAEKVKHEVRIIWGDYIKAPQMEKHPGVSDLVHQIMLKGSACKQECNRATVRHWWNWLTSSQKSSGTPKTSKRRAPPARTHLRWMWFTQSSAKDGFSAERTCCFALMATVWRQRSHTETSS